MPKPRPRILAAPPPRAVAKCGEKCGLAGGLVPEFPDGQQDLAVVFPRQLFRLPKRLVIAMMLDVTIVPGRGPDGLISVARDEFFGPCGLFHRFLLGDWDFPPENKKPCSPEVSRVGKIS